VQAYKALAVIKSLKALIWFAVENTQNGISLSVFEKLLRLREF
jgi:hypothetical protein